VSIEVVNTFLKDLIDIAAYTAISCWGEGLKMLASRGSEPDADAVLELLEEHADSIDVSRSIGSECGASVKSVAIAMLEAVIGIAKRVAPRELVEKLTYENALAQAEKRGLAEVLSYLKKYPKLSRKVIDWVRAKLLS